MVFETRKKKQLKNVEKYCTARKMKRKEKVADKLSFVNSENLHC